MARERESGKSVLVAVLKSRRDLTILKGERWYRMPVAQSPKRSFKYIAFYQPATFGKLGRCIRYYARVVESRRLRRRDFLPNEQNHPRAGNEYRWIRVNEIKKLSSPIRNRKFPARRVSFGFTTLRRLLAAKNVLQLYDVPPTEELLASALRKARTGNLPQHYVSGKRSGKKVRYYLDFAILCRGGKIAIECDNDKAHTIPTQKHKDKIKDSFLQRNGWTVIRLTESDVIDRMGNCVTKIQRAIRKYGGRTLSPRAQKKRAE
ncbi:MAG: hypothetical protein UY63_C0002G0013 [Parcubacteria group bacterium GW2011_GWA2_51_10]|nr:MAG: hypothetical protein UY63_C0002G0013 [Parcubacteria group bacterium GW2011_GWA2_51_10]